MFQPLVQNQSAVIFSKMLEKEDRIVYPKTQSAKFIFSHFRAYQVFPKTNFFDNYFECEIRLDECEYDTMSDFLIECPSEYSRYDDWIVLKDDRGQCVFLCCAENTFLWVGKITLMNGKQINFEGYNFVEK